MGRSSHREMRRMMQFRAKQAEKGQKARATQDVTPTAEVDQHHNRTRGLFLGAMRLAGFGLGSGLTRFRGLWSR